MSITSVEASFKLAELDVSVCQSLIDYCTVNHFSHIRVYKDNFYHGASTHAAYSNAYLLNLFNDLLGQETLGDYQTWTVAEDDESNSSSYKQHGISFFIGGDTTLDIFSFSNINKRVASTFFLSQAEKLKKFILFYNEKISSISYYIEHYKNKHQLNI